MPSCPGEEEGDFLLRITAREAGEVVEIFFIHADDVVRALVVFLRDEAGAPGREGDAFLREHTFRGRVHVVTDLFRRRGDGVHGDLLLTSGFADEIFHDEFRHGRAADVAVADKENVCHDGFLSVFW